VSSQDAIDFQAYAGSGTTRARSNVVRVAWAGPTLTWTGRWSRNEANGTLTLAQNGSNVTGTYTWSGGGTLTGTTSGGVLTGNFADNVGTGTFEIRLSADGTSYSGTYDGRHLGGGPTFSGSFSGHKLP
jgi:hypothetical protein